MSENILRGNDAIVFSKYPLTIHIYIERERDHHQYGLWRYSIKWTFRFTFLKGRSMSSLCLFRCSITSIYLIWISILLVDYRIDN